MLLKKMGFRGENVYKYRSVNYFFLFFHYENDLEATFKSTIPYFLKKS
jgi:hypothetical protein